MWKSRRKDKILEEGFFYYLHEGPGLCEAPLGFACSVGIHWVSKMSLRSSFETPHAFSLTYSDVHLLSFHFG